MVALSYEREELRGYALPDEDENDARAEKRKREHVNRWNRDKARGIYLMDDIEVVDNPSLICTSVDTLDIRCIVDEYDNVPSVIEEPVFKSDLHPFKSEFRLIGGGKTPKYGPIASKKRKVKIASSIRSRSKLIRSKSESLKKPKVKPMKVRSKSVGIKSTLKKTKVKVKKTREFFWLKYTGFKKCSKKTASYGMSCVNLSSPICGDSDADFNSLSAFKSKLREYSSYKSFFSGLIWKVANLESFDVNVAVAYTTYDPKVQTSSLDSIKLLIESSYNRGYRTLSSISSPLTSSTVFKCNVPIRTIFGDSSYYVNPEYVGTVNDCPKKNAYVVLIVKPVDPKNKLNKGVVGSVTMGVKYSLFSRISPLASVTKKGNKVKKKVKPESIRRPAYNAPMKKYKKYTVDALGYSSHSDDDAKPTKKRKPVKRVKKKKLLNDHPKQQFAKSNPVPGAKKKKQLTPEQKKKRNIRNRQRKRRAKTKIKS